MLRRGLGGWFDRGDEEGGGRCDGKGNMNEE